MDDDRIAEEPTRETVTPTRRTPIGGFCCCGKPYDPDAAARAITTARSGSGTSARSA